MTELVVPMKMILRKYLTVYIALLLYAGLKRQISPSASELLDYAISTTAILATIVINPYIEHISRPL